MSPSAPVPKPALMTAHRNIWHSGRVLGSQGGSNSPKKGLGRRHARGRGERNAWVGGMRGAGREGRAHSGVGRTARRLGEGWGST